MPFEVRAGDATRLGSHWDGEGVNFALFSAHADRVELCLYDGKGRHEVQRYDLPDQSNGVWHAYLPGLKPGAVYGYRVHGPFDPDAGHRFNSNKLLLDPYARQVIGSFSWHPSQFSYDTELPYEDSHSNRADNANWMLKAVVASPLDQTPVQRLAVPWHLTSIYETHLKGFTRLHPDIALEKRGKFDGLCDDKVIEYLKSLGVSSIELLPVQLFVDEYHLHEKKLSNYWGYNSLNFFTPQGDYHNGSGAGEFRHMVDRLHDAGLEVILDVVYNHTAEGDEKGPTLSFKGIDNASYYHLQAGNARHYVNDTGCGNTVDVSHPRVAQLVMDSLRYWSGDLGVDGFRFDLASVLGRQADGFNQRAGFFQAVLQDPQLADVKLIAEPWDIGPGGYQLGNFPVGWSEWNDVYRDTVRRFWRGEDGLQAELARRLHGSSDLFEARRRLPSASINFITSHDGFTLNDLVSYEEKHNEANAEDNQDGHNGNFSQNLGVEGVSSDPGIIESRRRLQRSLLATLLLSQGTPMLLAGDECSRTQQGNNNAYCQDNEINWFDWSLVGSSRHSHRLLLQRLMALREQFPMLSAKNYVHDEPHNGYQGILWINASGKSMTENDWHSRHNHLLGFLIAPEQEPQTPRQIVLVLLNNAAEDRPLMLPRLARVKQWQWLVDTASDTGLRDDVLNASRRPLMISSRSVAVLSAFEDPVT